VLGEEPLVPTEQGTDGMYFWVQARDPFLRDFTRAALEAPIPVLLGGHSLMSGGLMALNEYAWKQRDIAG